MANLSGAVTTTATSGDTPNVWSAPDNHSITGNITVNLTEDFAPTGTILQ